MSVRVSNNVSNKGQEKAVKWDVAIRDAELEINELVKKKTRLEQAIRIFRENKKDGMHWPSKELRPTKGFPSTR